MNKLIKTWEEELESLKFKRNIAKTPELSEKISIKVFQLESCISKLKEAINYTRCCTELPNKALKDSQLSDMVAGYKMMCRPDANFEKYYSKGFTECWEWLKRITK